MITKKKVRNIGAFIMKVPHYLYAWPKKEVDDASVAMGIIGIVVGFVVVMIPVFTIDFSLKMSDLIQIFLLSIGLGVLDLVVIAPLIRLLIVFAWWIIRQAWQSLPEERQEKKKKNEPSSQEVLVFDGDEIVVVEAPAFESAQKAKSGWF